MLVNQRTPMYEKKYTTAAIIAEYNPFHNGHKFHIEETRRITEADFVLVIMSGDFVQRGIPALFNKYERAKTALLNGADVVLELPSVYALSSAEGFATGAVKILRELNCIDYLSFGSESGDIIALSKEAELRKNLSPEVSSRIKELMKEGHSYPSSLNIALNRKDDLSSLSNNILAIEYINALIGTDITPITIKRSDNGYTNTSFDSDSVFVSASAIRQLIKDRNTEYTKYIPSEYNAETLASSVQIDDFSSLLYYKLLSEKDTGYTKYLDVDENLSGRIVNELKDFTDITSFANALKTKNYTYTRISRVLIHILLDITADSLNESPSYARLLGFRKEASALLHDIKENSSLELISKLSDAHMCPMLSKDIFAASVYEQINKGHRNEFRMSPIVID